MRSPLPFAILGGITFHHGGWTKGAEKMTWLTTGWAKVAALTLVGLAVHALSPANHQSVWKSSSARKIAAPLCSPNQDGSHPMHRATTKRVISPRVRIEA